MNDSLNTQVGGNHYTKLKIQPMDYSMANNLDPCQHTIIKYVTRFRDKNGIEDLKKARHTLDMLIEFEQDRAT
ncbi:SaV-like [uncultured Caudovirales phage]|uniref:SaV-like n=1 Tax=uncultured Caudovirales phage TaxID=2100421 RepID=A0A6J5KX08_9CAUD|nr:SaV-like [uncultured Caudovirales phage]